MGRGGGAERGEGDKSTWIVSAKYKSVHQVQTNPVCEALVSKVFLSIPKKGCAVISRMILPLCLLVVVLPTIVLSDGYGHGGG